MKKVSKINSPEYQELLTRVSKINLPRLGAVIQNQKLNFTGNKDVDISILSSLNYRDVLNICQTSTYFVNLCKDVRVWRNKLNNEYPLRSTYLPSYLRDLFTYNPRKLYETLYKSKSKIVFVKRGEIETFKNILREGDLYNASDEILQQASEEIRERVDELGLFRGDVVALEWIAGYRNDGKVMWDGENLVHLNVDIDDYGSVPEQFTFPEFPLDYFYESIEHNNVIWLSKSAVEEAIRNFNVEKQESTISDINGIYHVYPYIGADDKINVLTKEQFAKFVRAGPVIDKEGGDGEYLIGTWIGTKILERE